MRITKVVAALAVTVAALVLPASAQAAERINAVATGWGWTG